MIWAVVGAPIGGSRTDWWVVTNCFVSTGAVVSTPVYHPHTLLSSYCMFLPALFETKQQLKGTGRMSAMLCSPVSLQVVQ